MNREVLTVFASYPADISDKMHILRSLILDVAKEERIDVEECLKWGQPSYVSKKGSTLRIDWKRSPANQFSIYFNCKTTLVETFREIYPSTFNYIKNREISFTLEDKLPISELKRCVAMTLKYHSLKKIPLLGAYQLI